MSNFNIIWVEQPNAGGIRIKKNSRTTYNCSCHTEKTTLSFRDWIEAKKKRQPENCKGLFIYDILPTSPIQNSDEEIISEPAYLIRCDWINKISN